MSNPHSDGIPEHEGQRLRALNEMREMLIRGELKPGERVREVPLAARLGVSRTPLRLVLDRLEDEGLLEACPKRGFVVRQFTLQDLFDVIELRGVLEGAAARLAAERLESKDELAEFYCCLKETDLLLQPETGPGLDLVGAFIPLNDRFHAHLLRLAKSPMLRRVMEKVLTLPFARPDAFAAAQSKPSDRRDALLFSHLQHGAIVDAIENREGARAEAIAWEHSRNARRSVNVTLSEQRFSLLPGCAMVRIP